MKGGVYRMLTLAFHIAHPNQVPIKEESDLLYNTYPKSFVI